MEKEDLNQFIASLSSNEKGFIKKHLKKEAYKTKEYEKLFDLLVSKTSEENLKNVFHIKLASLKHILYKYMVEALIQYHKNSSPTYTIKMKLLEIELLMNKQQFNLCATKIKNLEKTLISNQNYISHLELFNYKDNLALSIKNKNYFIKNNYESTTFNKLLQNVKAVAKSRSYFGKALSFYPNKIISEKDFSLTDLPKKNDNFMSKLLSLYAELFYHRTNKNKIESLKIIQKLKQFIEESKSIFLSHPNFHVNTYNYIMTTENEFQLPLASLKTISEFKTILAQPKKKKELKNRLFISYYNITVSEMEALFLLKDYQSAANTISVFLTSHKKELKKIPESIAIQLHYYTALSFFLINDYKQVKRHLNKNITIYNFHKDQNFMNSSIILYLFSYYKTSDYEFIHRFLNQTIIFKIMESQYSERIIFWLDFFKKIATYPKHEHPELIKKTITRFDKGHPQNKELFNLFDIIEHLNTSI